MAKRLLSNPKIVECSPSMSNNSSILTTIQTVLWQTVAVECQGDGDLLNNLRIKNVSTGEESDLKVNGLFYAIGKKSFSKNYFIF